MLVHLDFGALLQLFCIVQGLTTGVYLLVARPQRTANKWLGLLLLGMTLQVVDYFLSRSGVYYRNRWLYFSPLFFSWSFGPLLLAYVRALRGRGRPLRWPHLLPGAVQGLFYLTVSAQSFDTKTWFWLTVHKPVTRYVEHYGTILSVLVYLALARRLLEGNDRSTRWLRRGLGWLAAFYVAAALDPLVNAHYLPAGAPKFYLTTLVLPVLAYALALAGWLQHRVAAGQGTADSPATPGSVPFPGALASSVTDEHRPEPVKIVAAETPAVDAAQLERVVAALEREQLFKDPELTLDGLAQHVGLTANVVSQTINAGLGQSFHDVVNGYRLTAVKQRLLTDDARRLTVLALALEAGFNSKTTFNRVFKEKTGLTPKEYQKKYQATRWDDSVPASG